MLEIEQIKEDIDYLKRDVKALLILDGYSKDAVKVVKRLYKELGLIIKENYGFNESGKLAKAIIKINRLERENKELKINLEKIVEEKCPLCETNLKYMNGWRLEK